jgi:hypothetical protein
VSSWFDQSERTTAVRRVSSAQADSTLAHYQSEASPPIGPTRLPSGPTHSSNSASPAGHPPSGVNSPRMGDRYSPLSTSPHPTNLARDGLFEAYPSAMARDARGQSEASMQYSSSAYGRTQPQLPSTTPPTTYASHYQAPIDLPSRRSTRELSRLPSLNYEDTTLSSDSGQTGYAANHPPSLLPIPDATKSMRVLPAPIPTVGTTTSPLDRPPPLSLPSSPQQHTNYRTSTPFAALVRAGELAARGADDEEMEMEDIR